MKALVVTKKGILEARDLNPGNLDPDKIRVRVEYAGVGFADMMAVRGGYALAPKRPFSPGYEFLGTIDSVGSRVRGVSPGLRVTGMVPKMACYRGVLDLDPVWAVAVPEGLASESAAALPLNYLTARGLIETHAGLQSGESFLIHGAAGGVGSAALEWARLKGLKAFGTVSTGKEADIEALGAVPVRRGDGWVTQARTLQPRGFQAVFDAFGGRLLRQSYGVLAPGGHLVSYGFSPTLDGGNGPLIDGLLFHTGKKLFPGGRHTSICRIPATIDRDRTWYRRTLETTLAEASTGRLNPRIHDVVPWDRAYRAHEAILAGKVRGKILLRFA